MGKVFVSYSRKQGEWVRDRLIPVLRAGGLEVLYDEDFEAARSLSRQIDSTQDQAERHLLVLSPDYLASDWCQHEMQRAIALDPDFETGAVIPVIRTKVELPDAIRVPNPLYVTLDEAAEGDATNWSRLLKACSAAADWSVPAWLTALDEVQLYLERRQSVSLVVGGISPWRSLIDELGTDGIARLDLDSAATHTDRGLVNAIFCQLGSSQRVAAGQYALADLERYLETMETPPTVAFLHFDRAGKRFDGDFFGALRYLIDRRWLVALFQSRRPFTSIVPADDSLSYIDLKRVDLE